MVLTFLHNVSGMQISVAEMQLLKWTGTLWLKFCSWRFLTPGIAQYLTSNQCTLKVKIKSQAALYYSVSYRGKISAMPVERQQNKFKWFDGKPVGIRISSLDILVKHIELCEDCNEIIGLKFSFIGLIVVHAANNHYELKQVST
jgi:hypothetical protein